MVPEHVAEFIREKKEDYFFVYDIDTMNAQMNKLGVLHNIDNSVGCMIRLKYYRILNYL